MVFGAHRGQRPGTAVRGSVFPVELVWDSGALGVFGVEDGPDAEGRACRAAARKHGAAGTFFAVEGVPWGVEMMEAPGVSELGADDLTAGAATPAAELVAAADAPPVGLGG